MKKNKLKVLFVAVSFALIYPSSAAVMQTASSWYSLQSSVDVNSDDLTGPIVGDGTNRAASGAELIGVFDGFTLAAANDSIELSGTVEMLGGFGKENVFRFGLLDVNGKAEEKGWLGYFASNGSDIGNGALRQRNLINNGAPTSDGGSLIIGAEMLAGEKFVATATNLYDFTIRYTREADDSLTIDWSLVRQDGGYDMSATYSDSAPLTYTFNRVAFEFNNSLQADQAIFTDVQLGIVPEPSAALLGGLGVLVLLRRRRA